MECSGSIALRALVLITLALPDALGICRHRRRVARLFQLVVSLAELVGAALGERPLGIQAGQVAAVARWLADGRGLGPVGLVTEGPRTGLIGLVAAALEVDAISGLEQRGAMASLREVIEGDVTVMQRPEQFCFGLLREFDVPQIASLVSPRPLVAR